MNMTRSSTDHEHYKPCTKESKKRPTVNDGVDNPIKPLPRIFWGICDGLLQIKTCGIIRTPSLRLLPRVDQRSADQHEYTQRLNQRSANLHVVGLLHANKSIVSTCTKPKALTLCEEDEKSIQSDVDGGAGFNERVRTNDLQISLSEAC